MNECQECTGSHGVSFQIFFFFLNLVSSCREVALIHSVQCIHRNFTLCILCRRPIISNISYVFIMQLHSVSSKEQKEQNRSWSKERYFQK